MIKLRVTGRIDPVFILKAFERGADGILVSGCHPNDCHYNAGNFHASRRWKFFDELLKFLGIEEEQLTVFVGIGFRREKSLLMSLTELLTK